MSDNDVLTNQFEISYDETNDVMRIFTVNNGKKTKFPIELRLATLQELGPPNASKWLGETIMLLVPALRTRLYGLAK